MKRLLFLTSIILFGGVFRFWKLDEIPPILIKGYFQSRIITTFLSLITIIFIYLLVKKNFKSVKLSLLTAYIFSLMPWVSEQARIVSPVSNTLFLLLLLIIFFQTIKNTLVKLVSLLGVPLILYFSYPNFWVWRESIVKLKLFDFFYNLFFLTSYDFLFFKNTTFWWGGIKEFGILYLSFITVFLVGFYLLIVKKKWFILISGFLILVISALSPKLPESREFFFITPILSLMIALGIEWLLNRRKFLWRLMAIILFLFFIYESAQFYHYYFLHYPQDLRGNISKINEPY